MSKIRPRRLTWWSASVGMTMLALGACSSGGKTVANHSSSTSAASPSSSASQPATGSPIKVGFICSCSGSPFAAFNVPGRDEYKAWENTVNSSGGIDGHPVQVIYEDDGSNPGTSVTDIQTLISDHVVVIADGTNFDEAWATTVAKANIPVVGYYTSDAPFGTNPDFYPEGQTNDSAIYAVLSTAKEAGATNLANVYCAESPICAESVPAFAATGKQLGVPVVYNAEISATAPNYTAQCVAAQQKGVKSVFIGDASAIIARVASNCTQQGFSPIYLQEGGGFGLNEASAAGLEKSLWLEFPSLPFFADSPAVKTANDAMDKYFPGARENDNVFVHDSFMAWSSGILLADAIKSGGLTPTVTPTSSEVVQGLTALKGDTLGGLAPPLTFVAGQPHTVDCWFVARVENGVPRVQNNGQPTCSKAS